MSFVSRAFPKNRRVRQRRDFDRIYKMGRVLQDEFFRIHYCLLAQKDALGRLGLTIGKNLGKAVQRNRIKRLLREVFRQHPALSLGLELVVQPKSEAGALPNKAIQARFLALLENLQRRLDNQDSRHL